MKWRTVLGMLVLALPATAAAQQPSQAQIGAVRQYCRSDYMAHCSSVPAGGAASLQCLQAHESELSRNCRGAVDAIAPPRHSEASPAPRQAARPAAQPTAGAAPGPVAAVSPVAASLDWPHTIAAGDATVVVYQPQVLAWDDRTHLSARAAVAVTRAGASQPFYGTLDIDGDTTTDFATRTVTFGNAHLVAAHFPSLDEAQQAQAEARAQAVVAALPDKTLPLDAVLLSLDATADTGRAVPVDNTPPAIFHATGPASLVVFDGKPVLAPIEGSELQRAVNTNWPVLFDPSVRSFFLLANGVWFAAGDVTQPWRPTATLPFASLPGDPNLAAVKAALPPRPPAAHEPKIFVSTAPAEIIVTAGPPIYTPIAGTGLAYAANTDSDLFRDEATRTLYYLLSGRWFSAPGLDGPWAFATANLPAGFARIPADSPRARVLASVPGTPQAQQTVIQAGIPRQATLSRAETHVDVAYAGDPKFEPIAGTGMQRALNAAMPVIKVGERYFVCWQGAWFVGPSPTGPFVLADQVPAEIYQIPPSSPLYPVTYVRVYSATPAAVTYGYTAGYALGFVSAGVLVYGTGYVYPPYVVPGRVPAYFPYPYTVASGVYYNPATGVWARGGAVYGPYGAARAGGVYNPATGAWAHGAAVYGPNGGAGAFSGYNPSTGRYAYGSASWGAYGGTAHASFGNTSTGVAGNTTQNWNAYGRWGSSTVSGPNQTVNTASASNARGSAGGFQSSTGAEGAGVHGKNGNNAGVVKGAGGNVYAGANGNVYRHDNDGWSKWNDGGWNQVQKPSGNGNGTRTGNATATATAPATAGNTPRRTGATQATPAPTARSPQRGQFGSAGEYGQLEQDRFARTQGDYRQRQSLGGSGSRGSGGRGGFYRRR